MVNWFDTLADNVDTITANMWNKQAVSLKTRSMTLFADSANQPSTDSVALGISTARFPVTYGIYTTANAAVDRLCWYTPIESGWDVGTMTAQVEWTSTSAGVTDVAWSLRAIRIDNNETYAAHAAPVLVAPWIDANQGSWYKNLTASTSFTITGTGNTILWEMIRDTTGDTLTADALLVAVKVLYIASSGL
jgi:hypothetical protein